MKQDFVVCKGKRYVSGDTMDILWYTSGYRNAHHRTGTFLDCDEDKDEYRFIVDGQTYCFNKVCFYQMVCDKPISKNGMYHTSNTPKQLTLAKELNIDGLLIAWIWYIFIMAIGTIFKGNIVIWAWASYVFFNYRNKKLREAGYKQ